MNRILRAFSALLLLMLAAVSMTPRASAATMSVKMEEHGEGMYVFSPKIITVNVGDTVKWENETDAPHTVTSDTGVWDSGNMNEGDEFSFTFKKAGTYPYYCKYHGGRGGVGMAGTVVVKGAGSTPSSNNPGISSKGSHGPTMHYTAQLSSLNNSGVTGTATFTMSGDKLMVWVSATGLVAGQVHMLHIHGLDNSKKATCPPASADANSDGIVSLQEGLPFYGAVLQPLTPYPTADSSGKISLSQTYTVDSSALSPLTNRVVVIHGLNVSGQYDASVPVACGQITHSAGLPPTGGGFFMSSLAFPAMDVAASSSLATIRGLRLG